MTTSRSTMTSRRPPCPSWTKPCSLPHRSPPYRRWFHIRPRQRPERGGKPRPHPRSENVSYANLYVTNGFPVKGWNRVPGREFAGPGKPRSAEPGHLVRHLHPARPCLGVPPSPPTCRDLAREHPDVATWPAEYHGDVVAHAGGAGCTFGTWNLEVATANCDPVTMRVDDASLLVDAVLGEASLRLTASLPAPRRRAGGRGRLDSAAPRVANEACSTCAAPRRYSGPACAGNTPRSGVPASGSTR